MLLIQKKENKKKIYKNGFPVYRILTLHVLVHPIHCRVFQRFLYMEHFYDYISFKYDLMSIQCIMYIYYTGIYYRGTYYLYMSIRNLKPIFRFDT